MSRHTRSAHRLTLVAATASRPEPPTHPAAALLVRQARLLVREREQTLAEATREADRLLGEAREQASRASAQTEIVRLAERHADELAADARRRSNELLSQVEDWADGHLAVLEANLANFLEAIRRGRERLQERSQETVVAGIRADGTSERAGTRS